MMWRILWPVLFCGLWLPHQACPQTWPAPGEMRSKKLIDAGIYTLWSHPSSVHSRLLAARPEFTRLHPFDGIALRALLAADWCRGQGLQEDPADPPTNQEPFLDSVAWSTRKIPVTAIEAVIADLQRVQWGTLTDNFLWYQFRDSGGTAPVDITQPAEWAVVKHNAVMAARICRQGKLKGLLFDTEQYGYRPLQKGNAELRQRLGREWMESVQAEYPEIRVMITFGWGPDLDQAEFLAGVKDFLNGMLAGLKGPARLINAYENTFYYGQGSRTRFTREGFPGDRKRYQETRAAIRDWRSFSTLPDKYDAVVQVGMAAWLESDPWNLTPGWPSAHRDTIWSNVSMALAASDEYTWCWSEHTDYLRTLGKELRNPFLASLTNQTFNTGQEATPELQEEFSSDPLGRGWYFDFDMLDVGRRPAGSEAPLIFTRQSVPYAWSPEESAVRVTGGWRGGKEGQTRRVLRNQRRRYVRPIQTIGNQMDWRAEFEFRIESLGGGVDPPIVLGLFQSGQLVDRQTCALWIDGQGRPTLVVGGPQGVSRIPVAAVCQQGRRFRLQLSYASREGVLAVRLEEPAVDRVLWSDPARQVVGLEGWLMDEAGAAQWDAGEARTPRQPYRYLLQAVRVTRSERR
ncbi:MAG: hypothetical protein VX346_17655 [Planctomycetota bacterium]|nr:hypothetical protein [Planctomycetota bacterium]